jgi:DNA adenine methylase
MAAIKGVPHPFPYQGSKRRLASQILSCMPSKIGMLYEPFAGSAAITVAAAYRNIASEFLINDNHEPVVKLWKAILKDPHSLCDQYENLWNSQIGQDRRFYDEVRKSFNMSQDAHCFLYLLARCVKAAVRYNKDGDFNNSPDKRRLGMKPATMRRNILCVSELLKGRVTVTCRDYKTILSKARKGDCVYMDPPYQGVCNVRDHRYCNPIEFDEFCDQLQALNIKGIDYLVSYDGRTGDKVHGVELPYELGLKKVEIYAGRSTQATLLGRNETTIESLYLSPSLIVDSEKFCVFEFEDRYPLFSGIGR